RALGDEPGRDQLLDELGDGRLREPGALGEAGPRQRRLDRGERAEQRGQGVLAQVCGLHRAPFTRSPLARVGGPGVDASPPGCAGHLRTPILVADRYYWF